MTISNRQPRQETPEPDDVGRVRSKPRRRSRKYAPKSPGPREGKDNMQLAKPLIIAIAVLSMVLVIDLWGQGRPAASASSGSAASSTERSVTSARFLRLS